MPKLARYLKSYYVVPGLRIYGAPVAVQRIALVIASVLGLSAIHSPIFGLVAISSYLAVILIHEWGHAFVASRQGLTVERIEVGWWHGSCLCRGSPDQWSVILVSWGGVLAQLAVVAVVALVAALLPGDDLGYFGPVLIFLGYFNFAVAIVNLAPSPGFDGAIAWRIFPSLAAGMRQRRQTRNAAAVARKKWGLRD